LSLFTTDVVSAGTSLLMRDGELPVPAVAPVPLPSGSFVMGDPERVRWWTDRLTRAAALLPPESF
jgi:hypothetical protein